MPVARSAALWGHVLTSLVFNAISIVVIILVAFNMDFRSPAGVLSWLAVGNAIWVALAWCIGIMLVAYIFAMRAYKRRM